MTSTENTIKKALEGTFGRLLFPLFILLAGAVCTGILYWFASHPATNSGHALLIVLALVGNLFCLVGGALGMQHYRFLGYMDALRPRDQP